MREFVELLLANRVDFVVVGAHALAFHGHPRYTHDIDLFVRRSEENARRIVEAIREFGFGSLAIDAADFLHPDRIVQLGMAPSRIDLLTHLSGVDFDQVWENRESGALGGLTVAYINRSDLKSNKAATARPKDLADLAELEGGEPEND